MPTLRAVLAAMTVVLAAPVAHADGIPMLPPCPDGTRILACHGPRVCAADDCTTDADCTGVEVCRDVSLCAASSYCGGGRPPPDTSPTGFAATSWERSCSEGCATGETCTPIRVCVAPSGPSSHATYCGCHAPGAGRASSALVALAAALVLVGARRR